MEPEDVIDAQREHNDLNRSLWNLGDKSGPCHARGGSNPPNGTPPHRSTRQPGEGRSNLPGECVRVIRCADTGDGRLADDEKAQRDTAASDRPNTRARRFWRGAACASAHTALAATGSGNSGLPTSKAVLTMAMRGVEMRRFVLFVVHPDHDAEEAPHGIS
jgi:hypothetical protein